MALYVKHWEAEIDSASSVYRSCMVIRIKKGKGDREDDKEGWRSMAEQWFVAGKLNSEHPAMSWVDKKRHHLKLTQLFSCKSQSIPQPFFTHTMSTRASCRPQTHNLPKTTNRATASANQDQCTNTQGEPTRIGMEGAFPPPTKESNTFKKGLLSIADTASVVVANDLIWLN